MLVHLSEYFLIYWLIFYNLNCFNLISGDDIASEITPGYPRMCSKRMKQNMIYKCFIIIQNNNNFNSKLCVNTTVDGTTSMLSNTWVGNVNIWCKKLLKKVAKTLHFVFYRVLSCKTHNLSFLLVKSTRHRNDL